MEQSRRVGRPRLLSDIPENGSEGRAEQSQRLSEAPESPPRPISASERQPHPLPSRLSISRTSHDTAYATRHQHLPRLYNAVMASSSSSIRPSSNIPAVQTSPPSPSSQAHEASPTLVMRTSSATDLRNTSPTDSLRGRARYRSASRPAGQTGTMDRKPHPQLTRSIH